MIKTHLKPISEALLKWLFQFEHCPARRGNRLYIIIFFGLHERVVEVEKCSGCEHWKISRSVALILIFDQNNPREADHVSTIARLLMTSITP